MIKFIVLPHGSVTQELLGLVFCMCICVLCFHCFDMNTSTHVYIYTSIVYDLLCLLLRVVHIIVYGL